MINKRCRVVKHHRSEGRVLSRNQEELILIAAFGAFWLGIPFFQFFLTWGLTEGDSVPFGDEGIQPVRC